MPRMVLVATSSPTEGVYALVRIFRKRKRMTKFAGDVAKAFGGGADFVMLGGMLAGHDECAGELIEKNGKKRKLFYGPPNIDLLYAPHDP